MTREIRTPFGVVGEGVLSYADAASDWFRLIREALTIHEERVDGSEFAVGQPDLVYFDSPVYDDGIRAAWVSKELVPEEAIA